MTYQQLREWLDCLTPAQLESKVMCYSVDTDSAAAVTLGFNTEEEMGVPIKTVKCSYPLLVTN